MFDDLWFERLADAEQLGDVAQEVAPARLKSKIYSALVSRMAESGALRDLAETKQAGGHLCVFENALTIVPVGDDVRSMNPCRICHARLLGERLEHAPIFWPGCPYSEYHNG
jgi:hypothetical protein